MATIKTSDLASKLKDQYLQQQDTFRTDLLVDGMGFLDYIPNVFLTKDEVPLTRVIAGDIVQPGAVASFSPSSDAITLKARVSKVRAAKVDLQFTPADIIKLTNSYYGYLAQMKKTYHDTSIAEFFMETIMKKVKENVRMGALYSGVYDAAGDAPADIFDGILTQMAVSGVVPSGNIYAGAAVTSSNALDIVEAIVANVNSKFYAKKLLIIAAPSTLRKYYIDYRATYGSLPYNMEFLKAGVDGLNSEFISEPALEATPNKIVVTTEDNLTWHVNPENDMDSVQIETALRNINVMIDFDVTPNFYNGDEIWTNTVS